MIIINTNMDNMDLFLIYYRPGSNNEENETRISGGIVV